MNKISAALLSIFCFVVLSACAQNKKLIVKTQGFYTIPMPGILPKDEAIRNQIKRDTVFTAFIETRSDSIKWEKAWKDGRSFSIISSSLKNTKVDVGQARETSKKIQIEPGKNNRLWMLELADDTKRSRPPQMMASGEVLLQGTNANKVFYHRIANLTELASPLYQ